MSNSDKSDRERSEEVAHHRPGEGHAHHQFDPDHADKFHDPKRLESLKLADLATELDVQAGDELIDLGTGSGACLPDLSRVVGSRGQVIGMDISQSMLDQAEIRVDEQGLNNVKLLRNEPDELPRPGASADAVLIVSSLHEFSDPQVMLNRIRSVLKPDGRLGIVEWRHEETDSGPPLDHRLAPELIDTRLTESGFVLENHVAWTDNYDLYVAAPK